MVDESHFRDVRLRFFSKVCERCGERMFPGSTVTREDFPENMSWTTVYGTRYFHPKPFGCPRDRPKLIMHFDGFGYDGGYTFPVESLRLEVPVADVDRITEVVIRNRITLAQALGLPIGTTVLLHHKGTGGGQ